MGVKFSKIQDDDDNVSVEECVAEGGKDQTPSPPFVELLSNTYLYYALVSASSSIATAVLLTSPKVVEENSFNLAVGGLAVLAACRPNKDITKHHETVKWDVNELFRGAFLATSASLILQLPWIYDTSVVNLSFSKTRNSFSDLLSLSGFGILGSIMFSAAYFCTKKIKKHYRFVPAIAGGIVGALVVSSFYGSGKAYLHTNLKLKLDEKPFLRLAGNLYSYLPLFTGICGYLGSIIVPPDEDDLTIAAAIHNAASAVTAATAATASATASVANNITHRVADSFIAVENKVIEKMNEVNKASSGTEGRVGGDKEETTGEK